MEAMLYLYITHRHKLIPSEISGQSLLQQMGCKAAENAQPAILSQTIKLGLKIDQAIIEAALRGCSFETFQMLWRRGFDVVNMAWWLDHAMLQAISACNHQMVEFCLDEGANPNSVVRLKGHGPLALAAVKGSIPILSSLIHRGAVVQGSGVFEASGRYGQTRSIIALVRYQQQAEIERRVEAGLSFPEILEGNLLPDELVEEDMTNAIVVATEARHEKVIEVLKDYGVDPAGRDANGRSALEVAELKGDVNMVAYLNRWVSKF